MRAGVAHSQNMLEGRIQEDKKFNLLLVFLWPVMAFANACRSFGNKFSRNIILFFYILYGFTFVVNPRMDGQRYADQLSAAHARPSGEFSEILDSFFAEEGDLDLVQPLVTFMLSRFTDNHHILFAIFAFIFGFFQLRSVYALYTETNSAENKNTALLLVFMVLLIPIFSINGFRMWTATWVFFYGCYNLIYLKKRIYYLVCLSATLVHFSFLTINVVLIAYLLLGNRRYIYAAAAAVSFSLSELPLASIKTYVSGLGGGLNTKFTAYTHKRYMRETSEMKDQAAWFMQLVTPSLRYFLVLGLAIIFFRIRKTQVSKSFDSLYCATLLFLTYANIVSLVPSGGRFLKVFFVFAVAVIALYYAHYQPKKIYSRYILLGIFPMLLFSVVNFRVGANTLNLLLFMPGPIAVFFNNIDIPVF